MPTRIASVRTISRRRLLGAAGGLVLASCTSALPQGDAAPSVRPDSPMAANAALGIWPDVVAKSPLEVRQAYAYAVAGPSSLLYIPCYCGCGSSGHTDNLTCYVQQFSRGGWVVIEPHATGCGVCVGITLDVMAMEKQGVVLKEIRRAVDAKWSKAGPGTNTRIP